MSDDVKLYTFARIAARPPQECHPETTYVDAREYYAAMAHQAGELQAAMQEIAELKKQVDRFVRAEMTRAEYHGFTYGQALDTIAQLRAELETAQRVREKLTEQRNGLIQRDSLGMALSDMTTEEMQAAYDAELAAIAKGGAKP